MNPFIDAEPAFSAVSSVSGEHARRLCMLSKPSNDAHVVVGSGAYGSWAVTELAEGGRKSVMFEARGKLVVANDFPAEAQGVGGGSQKKWWGASNRQSGAVG